MSEAQKGLWDSINSQPASDMPRAEKIDFDINIVHRVSFASDFTVPTERVGSDGDPYLIFNVKSQNVDKVIMSSAWTLLSNLKKQEPLAGKTFDIVKKLNKGKQFFEVTEVKN
jgi:hypothetical protein